MSKIKWLRRNARVLVTLLLTLVGLTVVFQNCAPNKFEQEEVSSLNTFGMTKAFAKETDHPVGVLVEVDFDRNSKADFVVGYWSQYSSDTSQYGSDLCLDAVENQFSKCFPLYSQTGENCETYAGIESCTPIFSGKENISAVSTGDFDRDGKQDIVLFGKGKGRVLLNRGMVAGKPSYQEKVFYQGSRTLKGTVTDFDGNGQADIVYFESYTLLGAPATSHLKVVYNFTGGTMPSAVAYNLPNATFFQQAGSQGNHTRISWEVVGVDLDQDGKNEVFVKTQYNEPEYILKYSSSQVELFEVPIHLHLYTDAATQFLDVNGDGKIDIFMPYKTGGVSEDLATVFINQGNLEFVPLDIPLRLGVDNWFQKWTDLNQDGKLDLVMIGMDYQSGGSVLDTSVSWGVEEPADQARGINLLDPEGMMRGDSGGWHFRSLSAPVIVLGKVDLPKYLVATSKGLVLIKSYRK